MTEQASVAETMLQLAITMQTPTPPVFPGKSVEISMSEVIAMARESNDILLVDVREIYEQRLGVPPDLGDKRQSLDGAVVAIS